MIEWCQFISKANHSASQQSKSMPQPLGQRSWTVLWRPIRPSRTNTKKDVLFIIVDWNAKVGSQEVPGVNLVLSTKWSQPKANRALPRECTGHSKHPVPTTQEMTLHVDITRQSTPKSDWLYSLHPKMEKLYTSQQKQDRELTVAQIMNILLPNSDLKWKKVWKNTRPLRNNLN